MDELAVPKMRAIFMRMRSPILTSATTYPLFLLPEATVALIASIVAGISYRVT
jgi:hypothetical protein